MTAEKKTTKTTILKSTGRTRTAEKKTTTKITNAGRIKRAETGH